MRRIAIIGVGLLGSIVEPVWLAPGGLLDTAPAPAVLMQVSTP